MKQVELNPERADAFGERMVDILNAGALAHMISIGHQTGLFDTLAVLPPATSGQVAEAAGLNERYVREWLNAMTTGRVVDYDPAAQAYALPAEHAQFLTRAAGSNNVGIYTQHISSIGAVEAQIVDCFYNGGGVPYEAFTRFHEVMAEDSNANIVSALLDDILPLVPGLMARLEAGIRVLDIGCGRGHALNVMARAFPNSQFSGYDLSAEGIAYAQQEAAAWGLQNVHFAVQDMTTFAETNRYDLITAFDAIHDQAFPARVLCHIHRALKADGAFLMQDIAASSHVHENVGQPFSPFLYTVSTMHCMTVSLAQGGEGLGTMWGREMAQQLLAEAGFRDVTIQQLPHDPMNDYYVSYPSHA